MEQYIVEGNIPVKVALLVQKRDVIKIIVDERKKDRDATFTPRQVTQRSIPIEQNSRQTTGELTQGKAHGELLALCGERRFQTPQAVTRKDSVPPAPIKGMEDPFNFGYTLHTLYTVGCDGITVPLRNWTTATGITIKANASTSEYLNLIVATDMEALLQEVKQASVQLIYAQRKDAISLYDYAFPLKLCLAIGGEMRGLSKHVQDHGDQNLFIPHRQDLRSAVAATVSTATFAFGLIRQKTAG